MILQIVGAYQVGDSYLYTTASERAGAPLVGIEMSQLIFQLIALFFPALLIAPLLYLRSSRGRKYEVELHRTFSYPLDPQRTSDDDGSAQRTEDESSMAWEEMDEVKDDEDWEEDWEEEEEEEEDE